MIYVGMDVSSKSFVVHAINERKKVVFKGEVPPSRAGLASLMGRLREETKLLVFEAGNQMKWIALWFKGRKDVHVHVVHPNEVKWISHSSGKTDKVDAKKLAELARGNLLPRKVHYDIGPSVRSVRLWRLLTMATINTAETLLGRYNLTGNKTTALQHLGSGSRPWLKSLWSFQLPTAQLDQLSLGSAKVVGLRPWRAVSWSRCPPRPPASTAVQQRG